MTTKKKLLSIFGPLIATAALLMLFFFTPIKINLDSESVLADASTAMSTNILRGNAIKNKAISSEKYIPFFGSSELSRISPFHPTVLAEKYDRSYRPFLLGAPGTQSLTQAMMMQSMGESLAHKKVVFIISPQWFVENGVTQDYFNAYYSKLHVYQWINNIETIDENDKYLAKRLLEFPKVKEDEQITDVLQNISEGQTPSLADKHTMNIAINILSREDELFSKIGMISKEDAVKKAEKPLPAVYSIEELDQLAEKTGRKATNNNKFEISNNFFTDRLKKKIGHLKGAQRKLDYRYSPEYSDFQLVLNQLAKNDADVLFIIPPVNQHWSDYTGLSQEMLREVSQKIGYQLRSQGFTNIADFSKKASTQYFMADTIHLGWRGWLTADQYINPFLESSKQEKHVYHLDDSFYSKKWQNQNPRKIGR